MAQVELKSIRKSFGSLTIIPDLDLSIKSGEFVVLVGPSGCGKSTLLRMIAGLDEPTGGTIAIGGKVVNDVSPKSRGIAMVFQNYALYPHMTVRQNLGFALKLARVEPREADRRISEAAGVLGLRDLLDRKPAQLSGGQRQRVAMGRAMVRQPKVLLFDEPLSNLDAQLRIKVRSEIALLHKRIGATVIYVTHDQVEAMTLADRIAVLNRGNLEQFGEPMEVYRHPKTQFVASFVGTPPMNFLPAREFQEVKAPSGAQTIGFRPDTTRLRSPSEADHGLNVGRGRVGLVEPLGGTAYVHVRLDAHSVVAELKASRLPALDEEISVWLDPEALFFFDSRGVRLPTAAGRG